MDGEGFLSVAVADLDRHEVGSDILTVILSVSAYRHHKEMDYRKEGS